MSTGGDDQGEMDDLLKGVENPDRKRGVLSTSDRQYLLGEADIEERTQSERNARARIRERILNGLLDFYLIDEYLAERDREQIAENIDADAVEGIHGLFAFLLELADDTERMEDWMEGGLMHRDLEGGVIFERPSVSLEIEEPTHVDPDETERKFREGDVESLSEGELRYLIWRLGQSIEQISPRADFPIAAVAEYADRIEENSPLAGVSDEDSAVDQ